MKKYFIGMFAVAAMLFATSCQNEELDTVQVGNEATVSFTLGVEDGLQTRAISDGSGAKQLTYRVFDKDGNPISETLGKVTETVRAYPHEVKLTLAKGQTYQIAFWAQNSACDDYTIDDNMNVSVNYAGVNNDEDRDAFFKAETFTVSGDKTIDVTLKRPFAQLNVGVTKADWDASVASGVQIVESSVNIKSAGTSINLLSGAVSGSENVEVKYTRSVIPTDWLEVNLDDKTAIDPDKEQFHWLSMSYILVNDGSENGQAKATLADVDFTFYSDGEPIVLDNGLNNVPVQRNWRTNILGKLLTGNITFNIVIDPIYNNDNNILNGGAVSNNELAAGVRYDAQTKTFFVYSAEGLQYLANVSNGTENLPNLTQSGVNGFAGYTIVLTSDIDLKGINWTPIGAAWSNAFTGTFDGNGYTISNLKTSGTQAAGLFGNVINTGVVKNVILSNADVTGSGYSGAVTGQLYGASVQGCTIRDSKVTDAGGWGRGGAVAGLSTDGTIDGCTVTNTDVVAISCVGGLTGVATAEHSATVLKNNVLLNVNVIKDITTYNRDNGFAGELIGQEAKPAAKENNTIDNVVVTILKGQNEVLEIATSEELFAFATLVNGGNTFAGKTVKLTADINLNGKSWTPIGPNADAANKFQGTFDGDGKTIYNLYVEQGAAYHAAGLFGALNGTVKNLAIDGANITNVSESGPNGTTNGTAVIAGSIYMSGSIEKVTVKNATVNGNRYVGGIAGYVYGSIKECHVETSEITATCDELTGSLDNGDKAGAVAGFFPQDGQNVIDACTVNSTTVNGYRDLGGIVGWASGTVTNNTVGENVTLASDRRVNYKGYKTTAEYDVNSIIGEGAADESNTGSATIIFLTKSLSVIWADKNEGATEDNICGSYYNKSLALEAQRGDWRLPTGAECLELVEWCDWEETTVGGIAGCQISNSDDGQSFFIPYASYYNGYPGEFYEEHLGSHLYLWTSDHRNPENGFSDEYYFSNHDMLGSGDEYMIYGIIAQMGFSVRLVKDK